MRTIAWDVDDVLAPLTRAWLGAHAAAHPGTPPYEALTENPPHAVLGLSHAAYLASLDAFRIASYGTLQPDAEILAWFRAHGPRFRHVALTATARHAAPFVSAWVLTHFGDWIRTFAFVPSPRAGEQLPVWDPDKGHWLAWFDHADVLIDDHPANIAAARREGRTGYLVQRPWSPGGRPLHEILAELTRHDPGSP